MTIRSKTKIAYPIPQGVESIRAREDFGVPIVPAPDKETALEWVRTCVPDEAIEEGLFLLEQAKAGAEAPEAPSGKCLHTVRQMPTVCQESLTPAYILTYIFNYILKYNGKDKDKDGSSGVGQPTRLNTSTRTAKTAKTAKPKGLHHARVFLPTLQPRVFPAHVRLWLAIVAKASANKETAIRVSQEIDALAGLTTREARSSAIRHLEEAGMVRVIRKPGKRPTLVLKFHAGFPVALDYDPATTSKGLGA